MEAGLLTATNGDNAVIKKELPDLSTQSDKVLQFSLLLQRSRVSEVITVTGHDQPTALDQPANTIACIDLTLSDDEEDDLPTNLSTSIQGQDDMPMSDSDIELDLTQVTVTDTGHPDTEALNDEGRMDYAAASSSLEVQRQKGPSPFEIVQTRSKSRALAKRPHGEPAVGAAKRPTPAVEQLLSSPQHGPSRTGSASPVRDRSGSHPGSSDLDINTSDSGSEADRVEARTGNRNTLRRIHSNGRTYEGSKSHKCLECPYSNKKYALYVAHVKGHRIQRKFRCYRCSFSAATQSYLSRHLNLHLAPDTTAVPHDLSEEDYTKLISGNPRFAYMTQGINGQPLPPESSFKCWNCPYATLNYSLLVAHVHNHGANSKYVCNKCSYSASTIQGLKNHSLAHTIQHAVARRNLNGQQALRTDSQLPGGSTPRPLAAPPKSGQYFLSNIRIENIMGMSEEPTVDEVSRSGILKLQGTSAAGKSSYIFAVMLGLGYDLCLAHRDATTSICGLNLKDAISNGRDSASVELTVSLRAYPDLQQDFGSHAKFLRRLSRAPSDLSNVVFITSADPRPEFCTAHPTVLGGKDLRCFLRKFKLSPESLRLMLLDGENVKYMVDNQQCWYGLYEAALQESQNEGVQKSTEAKFLLQRLQGREKLQRERLEWFESRLEIHPGLNSETIRQVNEEDLTKHRECTAKMKQLANERQDLEQRLRNCAEEAAGVAEDYLVRMRTIFSDFLEQLNYHGEIMVDDESRQLSICIWGMDSDDPPPTTMQDVGAVWRTLSNAKRRLAVIGLYLALWEVSSYLGLLAADAFSCTQADFCVPPAALPVLWNLLSAKCLHHTQSIITLPPDY